MEKITFKRMLFLVFLGILGVWTVSYVYIAKGPIDKISNQKYNYYSIEKSPQNIFYSLEM